MLHVSNSLFVLLVALFPRLGSSVGGEETLSEKIMGKLKFPGGIFDTFSSAVESAQEGELKLPGVAQPVSAGGKKPDRDESSVTAAKQGIRARRSGPPLVVESATSPSSIPTPLTSASSASSTAAPPPLFTRHSSRMVMTGIGEGEGDAQGSRPESLRGGDASSSGGGTPMTPWKKGKDWTPVDSGELRRGGRTMTKRLSDCSFKLSEKDFDEWADSQLSSKEEIQAQALSDAFEEGLRNLHELQSPIPFFHLYPHVKMLTNPPGESTSNVELPKAFPDVSKTWDDIADLYVDVFGPSASSVEEIKAKADMLRSQGMPYPPEKFDLSHLSLARTLGQVPELDRYEFNLNSVKEKDVLGKGSQGKVYRAKIKASGVKVALKVEKFSGEKWTNARKEVDHLMRVGQVPHPNVNQMLSSVIFSDGVLIFMELGPRTSLEQYQVYQGRPNVVGEDPINPLKDFLMEEAMQKVTLQTLRGLDHIHHFHHTALIDLKPGNILISEPKRDTQVLVQIIDFGLAHVFRSQTDPEAFALRGTAHYFDLNARALKKEPGLSDPQGKPGAEVVRVRVPQLDLYTVGSTVWTLMHKLVLFFRRKDVIMARYRLSDQLANFLDRILGPSVNPHLFFEGMQVAEWPPAHPTLIEGVSEDSILPFLSAEEALKHPWLALSREQIGQEVAKNIRDDVKAQGSLFTGPKNLSQQQWNDIIKVDSEKAKEAFSKYVEKKEARKTSV